MSCTPSVRVDRDKEAPGGFLLAPSIAPGPVKDPVSRNVISDRAGHQTVVGLFLLFWGAPSSQINHTFFFFPFSF